MHVRLKIDLHVRCFASQRVQNCKLSTVEKLTFFHLQNLQGNKKVGVVDVETSRVAVHGEHEEAYNERLKIEGSVRVTLHTFSPRETQPSRA